VLVSRLVNHCLNVNHQQDTLDHRSADHEADIAIVVTQHDYSRVWMPFICGLTNHDVGMVDYM
jgi:hypothetical protein